jgi:hypothetical protein
VEEISYGSRILNLLQNVSKDVNMGEVEKTYHLSQQDITILGKLDLNFALKSVCTHSCYIKFAYPS